LGAGKYCFWQLNFMIHFIFLFGKNYL
jgi:hypothetical protein